MLGNIHRMPYVPTVKPSMKAGDDTSRVLTDGVLKRKILQQVDQKFGKVAYGYEFVLLDGAKFTVRRVTGLDEPIEAVWGNVDRKTGRISQVHSNF